MLACFQALAFYAAAMHKRFLPGWFQAVFAILLSSLGLCLAEGVEEGQGFRMLVDYFEQMSAPKPFLVREGQEFKSHQAAMRRQLLEGIALWPLPERLPLNVATTEALDHPWCTVRRVYYQLWPGVYASGLLFVPKEMPERPAPAMLCPHGHWGQGNAHPIVQSRCLVFAKMGYVTFSPNQNHYEDLNWGISHQTLGVWGNVRALDFLQSLPEVDRERIGVCGESGGGLQTQMLTALDPRVRAATVAGMTCNFREIIFPHTAHCDCNHFPNVMRWLDAPELSALSCPVPIQYLTMNDWTRNFQQDDYPAITRLYAANGAPDRTHCRYEATEHTYDRSKREWTYWWMDKWLRGRSESQPPKEPEDLQTFPPAKLLGLKLVSPQDNQFAGISEFYRARHRPERQEFTAPEEWKAWRRRMTGTLKELLGEDARLPRPAEPRPSGSATVPDPATTSAKVDPSEQSTQSEENLAIDRVDWASEGPLRVSAILMRSKRVTGKRPVVVICDGAGKESAARQTGPASARQLTESGSLVVLPDLRFTGAWSWEKLAEEVGPALVKHPMAYMLPAVADRKQRAAGMAHGWERNAILWGRPLAAMAGTDLRAVLDGLAARPDADLKQVRVISRGSGALAAAVLFAAALDERIAAIDVDWQNCCYANKRLPALPFILWHGDVLDWAALIADRQVTLRNVPAEAGDPAWLAKAFALTGNPGGLHIEKP
jgi:dienelactone hydrolase